MPLAMSLKAANRLTPGAGLCALKVKVSGRHHMVGFFWQREGQLS
jgi:hypothetical protein